MSQSFGQIIVAWFPLVLLMVVFAYVFRKAGKQYQEYYKHVEEVNDVNRQIVETNREMIAELREIKQILKDQA